MKPKKSHSLLYLFAVLLLSTSLVLSGCQLNWPSKATATPISIPTLLVTQHPQATEASMKPSPTPQNQATATRALTRTATIPPVEDVFSAIFSEVSGEVYALQPGAADYARASNTLVLPAGGKIKTMDNSKVRLDFSNENIVRLGPNSLFTVVGEEEDEKNDMITKLVLEAGQIWAILTGGVIEVDTPSGVASVRGSYLSVYVDPQTDTVYITCLEGICRLENEAGFVEIVAGQTATIINATTPPSTGLMSQAEILLWLQWNPEATIVIPAYTLTAGALPTSTPTKKPPSGTIP